MCNGLVIANMEGPVQQKNSVEENDVLSGPSCLACSVRAVNFGKVLSVHSILQILPQKMEVVRGAVSLLGSMLSLVQQFFILQVLLQPSIGQTRSLLVTSLEVELTFSKGMAKLFL